MFVSLNLFTFPFRSDVLVWDPWLPENVYLNLAVKRLLFPFTRSTDSFCLTALTLAGQVPPVPVCTLLWLVPQTVCCLPHIRLTPGRSTGSVSASGSCTSSRPMRILLTNRIVWVDGWGGLGLIIMSNLKLSWVKLMLGWVVTIKLTGIIID